MQDRFDRMVRPETRRLETRMKVGRQQIHKQLDDLLEQSNKPDWWGEVGITVTVQNGKTQVVRKRIEKETRK